MKVKFYLDSTANIHSCRKESIDTIKDLGLEDGEWEDMSDEDKSDIVKLEMFRYLDYGWEDQ